MKPEMIEEHSDSDEEADDGQIRKNISVFSKIVMSSSFRFIQQ